MTNDEIKNIYENNRQADWKRAFNAALKSCLDEGMSYPEAVEAADKRMMDVLWHLSNTEAE